MLETAAIPHLDFSKYTHGSSDERVKFCQDLASAFQRWGFLKLDNYGINPEEVAELFIWSRRFFSLDEEQKMQCAHPPVPNPHRGYSYVGQETTAGLGRAQDPDKPVARKRRDLKASFDFGAAHDTTYPNRWPDESTLPGFRDFIERFYAQAHMVHLNVMEALAESLGIAADFFLQAHTADESEMRLAHYPAVEASQLGAQAGTGRIFEHTDSGSLTLLWQDSVGGLEVEDPESHKFLPVECPHPSLLINIGDSMERWSNGMCTAAYHRVQQPAGQDQSGRVPERLSMAYFGKPDRQVSLGPLPQFVTPERPAKYSTATGAELNQSTLLRTYEPQAMPT